MLAGFVVGLALLALARSYGAFDPTMAPGAMFSSHKKDSKKKYSTSWDTGHSSGGMVCAQDKDGNIDCKKG